MPCCPPASAIETRMQAHASHRIGHLPSLCRGGAARERNSPAPRPGQHDARSPDGVRQDTYPGRRMRLNSPVLRGSCYFVGVHRRPRDEEPGSRCKAGRAVLIVAPPLRRLSAPSVRVSSNPRSSADRRPPPAACVAASLGAHA